MRTDRVRRPCVAAEAVAAAEHDARHAARLKGLTAPEHHERSCNQGYVASFLYAGARCLTCVQIEWLMAQLVVQKNGTTDQLHGTLLTVQQAPEISAMALQHAAACVVVV